MSKVAAIRGTTNENCYPASTGLRAFKLILAGFLTLSFLFNATILWNELPNIFSGYGDFVIFYSGAQILKDGNGDKLYDLAMQRHYHRELGFVDRGGILPFNHPPYELLPLIPLARFPYRVVYVISAIANILLLVLISKLLLPLTSGKDKILVAGVLFAFSPTMVAILNGQDSIISAFLLTATFVSLKHSRDSLGGICLALGLYKPQLVLPFAFLLLVKRRWTVLLAFTATGALLVVLSVAIIGWGGVIAYIKLLLWMDQTHYTIYPEHMANIRGLAEVILHSRLSTAGTNIFILFVSVFLYLWCLYLWRGTWEPTQRTFDLKFVHLMITTILISYHLYPYDLVLLGLALIVILDYVLAGPVTSQAVRVMLLGIILLFSLPLGLHLANEAHQIAWMSLVTFALTIVLAKEIGNWNSKCNDVVVSRG